MHSIVHASVSILGPSLGTINICIALGLTTESHMKDETNSEGTFAEFGIRHIEIGIEFSYGPSRL